MDSQTWSDIGYGALQVAGAVLPQLAAVAVGDSYSKSAKLMEKQNQLAMANWREANEYNKPSNQLSRIRESGLNPNLVYGHGSIANTSSSAPSPSVNGFAPYTGFSTMGQFGINTMLQDRLNKSTIRLQESQEAKNEADASNVRAANAGIAADSLSKINNAEISQDIKEDLKQQVHNATEISYNNIVASREENLNKHLSNVILGKQSEKIEEQLNLQLSNLRKQGQLTDAQASSARASASKSFAEIKRINKDIQKLQIEIESTPDTTTKRMHAEQILNLNMARNIQLFNVISEFYNRGMLDASTFMKLFNGETLDYDFK